MKTFGNPKEYRKSFPEAENDYIKQKVFLKYRSIKQELARIKTN